MAGAALGFLVGTRRGPPVEPGPRVETTEVDSVQAETTAEVAANWETREGRLAAMSLSEQNDELRAETERLKGQVEEMLQLVAAEKVERDLLAAEVERARRSEPAKPGPGVALRPADLRVVEVNPSLGLVVVNGGRAVGLRPGMPMTVVRNEAAVGRARIVAVREHLAGAAVEELKENGFVVAGDRVLPARTADR